MKVGMELTGTFRISFSDFALRRILGDAHDFVVVYKCHNVRFLRFNLEDYKINAMFVFGLTEFGGKETSATRLRLIWR